MHAHFKMFKSSVKTWQTLFEEAGEFASNLGERQLINISHSCDHGTAVVVVWYWDKGRQSRTF
jgi:hypothetical protein